MKIDRRRFLALTTAMTAAHCATPPPPIVTVPPEDVPVATASAPSSSQSPTSSEAAAASPEAKKKTPSSLRGGEDDGSMDLAASEGVNNDQTTADASKVKGQKCPSADNMKGSPGSCATLKPPGPTCESFSDTKSQCDATRTWLKPRVAEKAIQCHLAKSGTNKICKFNLITDCVTEALASTCVDPGAAAICKPIITKCGGGGRGYYASITQDSCEAAVSAVSDAQRSKFISCVTEFCRFETCFYHLVSTPTAESKRPTIFRR